MVNGNNAGHEQLSPFPTVFSKDSLHTCKKQGLFWKGLIGLLKIEQIIVFFPRISDTTSNTKSPCFQQFYGSCLQMLPVLMGLKVLD